MSFFKSPIPKSHSWTKWTLTDTFRTEVVSDPYRGYYGAGSVTLPDPITVQVQLQRRTCEDCGITQEEHVGLVYGTEYCK